MNLTVFKSSAAQWGMLGLLIAYFFGYTKTPVVEQILVLPLGVLFAWLIVNIGANDQKAFSFQHSILDRLGKISYGIYMYHMIVVYFTSFLFTKIALHETSLLLHWVAYFTVVSTGTFVIAYLSYEYFEKRLLKMGHRFSAFHAADQTPEKEGQRELRKAS